MQRRASAYLRCRVVTGAGDFYPPENLAYVGLYLLGCFFRFTAWSAADAALQFAALSKDGPRQDHHDNSPVGPSCRADSQLNQW